MKKIILSATAATLLLAGCSANKENQNAQELLTDAETAFDAGDYTRTLSLIDSLQKSYPAELTLQRQAMALRPKAIEQATMKQISTYDSLITLAKVKAEQLKPELKWIKKPRMVEGYWIAAKSYNPGFMNTTGIEARVSEIGQFYIVSSMNPSKLKHTSITLSIGNGSATTPAVEYDGESNYRIAGSEVITFSPEKSDTIGSFAASHPASPATLTFNGNGNKTIKLTATQTAGIAKAYEYSRAIVDAREMAVERERLDRTLQIARSQIARTAETDDKQQ